MFTKRKGIMLAYPFEEKRLKKWTPPFLLQPKLDGNRCRAIFDALGNVTLLSSTELPIDSVPHINATLESLQLKNMEFDGELYNHEKTHQEINSIVSRTQELHSLFFTIEYHVFDCINYLKPSMSQMERVKYLREVLPSNLDYIKRVPNFYVDNLSEIMKEMERLTDIGYEGIIVRNLDYLYLRKRSTGMMKFKPKQFDLYVIVGYEEEIDQFGDPKNSLGALVLKSDEGQIFKVGTGSFLTRDRRKRLWRNREVLIGQIAEVAYQHITSPPRSVPRFPVLLDIKKI